MEHYWLIYLMGAAGIWKAIPLGLVLQVNPVIIGLMTILGAVSALMVIYIFGKRIKRYYLQRMERKRGLKSKGDRFSKLFEKYGAPGVGLIGSLIFGPNMTMILGLVIIRNERKLLAWTIAGTVLWTSLLIVVAGISIELFNSFQIL